MPNRIAELRQSRGLTQQALAEAAGTTAPQISKLENGERRLTAEWMRRLGTVLGVDAGALIGDGISTAAGYVARPRGQPALDRPGADLSGADMPGAAPSPGPAAVAGGAETVRLAGEDYALVPVFAARAAAGAGAVGGDDRVARLPFRIGWLRGVSDSPVDALGVIEVEGDSMEPTLRPGDQILVDTAPRSLRSDGIYVLRRDHLLQVKRLGWHPGTGRMTVSSDNPRYPSWPDLDPAEIEVVGRVIWLGRRV